MAVNLNKGGKINLSKTASDMGLNSLKRVRIGLGWDANQSASQNDFDLDAVVFLLNSNGRVRSDSDFIFYGNLASGGVIHNGDNRTGNGDGDDETIDILIKGDGSVDDTVSEIKIAVTIYEASERHQNFGMVENSFVRVLDADSGKELVRYDLKEDFSIEQSVIVCSLKRVGDSWQFEATGEGYNGDLGELARSLGVNV